VKPGKKDRSAAVTQRGGLMACYSIGQKDLLALLAFSERTFDISYMRGYNDFKGVMKAAQI